MRDGHEVTSRCRRPGEDARNDADRGETKRTREERKMKSERGGERSVEQRRGGRACPWSPHRNQRISSND
jgi:hypothetical protein